MITSKLEFWQSLILDGEQWPFYSLEVAVEMLAGDVIGDALMDAFPHNLSDYEKACAHYLVEKRMWSWRAYLMGTIRSATAENRRILERVVPEFTAEVRQWPTEPGALDGFKEYNDKVRGVRK